MKRMLIALTLTLAATGLWLASGAVLRPGLLAQEEGGKGKADKEKGKPAAKEGKMMQCPMMAGLKGIELFADGPESLLAEAKRLELSDEQVKRLKAIAENSRDKAREVLTDKQRAQLAKAAKGRVSLMELSRMRAMAKHEDGMCPMCLKMMQKMKGKAKERAEDDD